MSGADWFIVIATAGLTVYAALAYRPRRRRVYDWQADGPWPPMRDTDWVAETLLDIERLPETGERA